MNNTSDLKSHTNTPTLHLVLLTIATAGIYSIMWLYKRLPGFDQITGKSTVSSAFIVWIAVCGGLSGALQGSGDETLDAIAGIFIIANAILYILLGFKMKAALESYASEKLDINLKLNPILTFAINIYYINFHINKLAEQSSTETVDTP